MGEEIDALDDGLLTRTYELGLKWMQCREYSKALGLFSKAMKVSRSYPMEMVENIRIRAGMPKRCAYDESKAYHPLYVKLLDSRISCLMKVGDYARAVKESQYFCKIEPSSTRALLRLGKSYELADKGDRARQVYKSGRKLVKELKERGVLVSPVHEKLFSDRYEELLKRNAMQLVNSNDAESGARNSEQIPSKKRVLIEQKLVNNEDIEENDLVSDTDQDHDGSTMNKKMKRATIDPIQTFPTELVISIMRRLDTKDITSCMLVSKFWYRKLSTTPMIIDYLSVPKTNYSKINSLLRFVKTKRCVSSVIQYLNFSVMATNEEAKCSQLLFNGLDQEVKKLVLQFTNLNILKVLQLISDKEKLIANLQEFSVFGHYDPNHWADEDVVFLERIDNLKKIEVLIGTAMVPGRNSSIHRRRQLQFPNNDNISRSLQSIKLIFKDNGWTGPTPFACIFSSDTLRFANVSKLIVTNRDIRFNQTADWIKKFPNLTDLWLERNTGLSLMGFLQSLQEPNVLKRLKYFTFRESSTESNRSFNGQMWTDEQIEPILANLGAVQTLDIMNSAIARSVLYRLLNELPSIRKLNIGNVFEMSDELYPRTDIESTAFLFLRHMTHLRDLSVPNMSSHQVRAFRQLALVISEIGSLSRLDLSFNPSMQGYQLYDIIRELFDNGITLKTLVIDGCSHISATTVKDIERNGYVENIECAFNKQQWEKFGVNSFWYR